MLYFITTTFNEIPWKVGEDVPQGLSLSEIQASGDELKIIRSLSEKIPPHGSSGNKWMSQQMIRWNQFDAANIYNLLQKI